MTCKNLYNAVAIEGTVQAALQKDPNLVTHTLICHDCQAFKDEEASLDDIIMQARPPLPDMLPPLIKKTAQWFHPVWGIAATIFIASLVIYLILPPDTIPETNDGTSFIMEENKPAVTHSEQKALDEVFIKEHMEQTDLDKEAESEKPDMAMTRKMDGKTKKGQGVQEEEKEEKVMMSQTSAIEQKGLEDIAHVSETISGPPAEPPPTPRQPKLKTAPKKARSKASTDQKQGSPQIRERRDREEAPHEHTAKDQSFDIISDLVSDEVGRAPEGQFTTDQADTGASSSRIVHQAKVRGRVESPVPVGSAMVKKSPLPSSEATTELVTITVSIFPVQDDEHIPEYTLTEKPEYSIKVQVNSVDSGSCPFNPGDRLIFNLDRRINASKAVFTLKRTHHPKQPYTLFSVKEINTPQ